MTDKLAWVAEELHGLKQAGLYNHIRTINSAQAAWLQVDGKRALNFCSNNYLGLANHPRLRQAAQKAMDSFGLGPAAVRSIAGTTDLHVELDRRMAAFKGVDAAITFQSGFVANLGVIPALVGKEDVIFSDELNHASIIDGSRLAGATIARYKHCDAADLGEAILMVDDAHGEGVLGKGGRGIVDHFGLHGKVDVEVGTFSKAFGVVGGVAAGNADIVEWLHQRGRPFLFSSAMTVPDVGACLAAGELLQESTELVERLWSNTEFFKGQMKQLGFDTGRSQTPITPVMLGEAKLAQDFSRALFEAGVFALSIGFPTGPRDAARIRVMISAAHST